MTKTKTTVFDPAEHLETPEDIAAFLDDMLQNGTPEDFVHGLGIAARAAGMSKVAKNAGVGRESLYKSLTKESKPEFGTIFKVIQALHLSLRVAA